MYFPTPKSHIKKKQSLLCIVAGLIVVQFITLAWLTRFASRKIKELYVDYSEGKGIPRIIWTYWDTAHTIPDFARRCWCNWQRYNPDSAGFVLNIVYASNVSNYVTGFSKQMFDQMSIQARNAWVQSAVLSQHGGIWIDACTVMTKPILQWLPVKSQLVAFFMPSFSNGTKSPPILDRFFLACVPGCQLFFNLQKEIYEFHTIYHADEMLYLEHLRNQYGDKKYKGFLQRMPNDIHLTMHIMLQKVYQIDFLPTAVDVQLLDAESGPYQLQAKSEWNADEFIKKYIMNNHISKWPDMIKFRNVDRYALTQHTTDIGEGSNSGIDFISKYIPYNKC